MIRSLYRRHKGFLAGILLASLLWSLGLIYMTHTNMDTHAVGRRVTIEDINRRAINRMHPRVQRTIGHNVRNNLQQQKSSPTTPVTMVTDTSKARQSKMIQKLTKNKQVMKQPKPSNFSVKFGKPVTSIRYKSKDIPVSEEVRVKSQFSRPPLFISDHLVAVMGVDFWMEAGMTRSEEEKQQSEAGFTRHAFNQFASDRLGYFREIPDTRHNLCHSLQYPSVEELPNTSIIICFHNEAQSALLRTVHSVIQRSPAALLHEIILVDDASTFDDLKGPLDEYVAKHLPIVTVIRTVQREGLIRARLLGARHATGMVLTFLDSHCEVNRDWLVPLLSRLKGKPTEAVVPVIDVINPKSLAYTWVSLNKGGFDWGLSFKWHPLNEHTWDDRRKVQPFSSPAMAGGLFSIYRKYFYAIGSYDEGMDIWGGENIEISLRLWMCGGGVEIVPCSRVGHIFRSGQPYSSPGGDTMGRNVIRVAEVWLDQYKKTVYQKNPLLQTYEQADISDRLLLRKQLQCHSFQWYLDNVYPELVVSDTVTSSSPPRRNTLHQGVLRSISSRLCLTLAGNRDNKTHSVAMTRCDGTDKNQEWSYTESKQLMQNNLCLQLARKSSDVIVASLCKDSESDDDKDYYSQLWLFEQLRGNQLTGKLHHAISERCLHDNGRTVTLNTCNANTKWIFITS